MSSRKIFDMGKKHRQQQRTKESNAAYRALEPFLIKWFDRGRTGWFKRGDVARVLKISPKEAGVMLQLVLEANSLVLRTENGWWHATDKRVKPSVSSQRKRIPVSTVAGTSRTKSQHSSRHLDDMQRLQP